MERKSTARISILAVIALMCLPVSAFTPRASRAEYIAKYKDLAISQMIEYGIPASITLAQGCLESGDGNSTLAREANNHFGIKCHGWSGPSIRQDDDEKNECFRKYDSPEQSFKDHSDFLRYRDRYAKLFELERTDYKGWAYGLKAAGYATAPSYAQSLIKIIEEYNLSQYDVLTSEAAAELPPTPSQAAASITLKPRSDSPLYRISLYREVLEQNGVAYIVSNGMDTFGALAKEYNLFKRELLVFNDLKRDGKIEAGTRIYLEKKKKESARHLDKHVFEEGETMYGIAQRYAVQLKCLYKYNNIKEGSEPQPGDIILLRNPAK